MKFELENPFNHNYIEDLKSDIEYKEYLESLNSAEENINTLESIKTLEEYLSNPYKNDCFPETVAYLKAMINHRDEEFENIVWTLDLDEHIDFDTANDNEIFSVIEELVFDKLIPNEIENWQNCCHFVSERDGYLSIDETNDKLLEHSELIEDSERQWNWIQKEIINSLNPKHIVDIDTSHKSISTYITCYTKNYHEILETIEGYIEEDDIKESLSSEFEYDEETFTIRISDHEIGGRYDEYSGCYRSYARSEISIKIPHKFLI